MVLSPNRVNERPPHPPGGPIVGVPVRPPCAGDAQSSWTERRDHMPYKSDAQRRWAHTEKGKKALGGAKKVAEWDRESKGKKLPEKKGK